MEFYKILWNPDTGCAYSKKTIYSTPVLRCKECGNLIKNHKMYDFSLMLSKEKPLSDLMTSLYSVHVISQRAYDVFKKEKFNGYEAKKIKLFNSKKIEIEADYYSIQYTGRLTVDYKKNEP